MLEKMNLKDTHAQARNAVFSNKKYPKLKEKFEQYRLTINFMDKYYMPLIAEIETIIRLNEGQADVYRGKAGDRYRAKKEKYQALLDRIVKSKNKAKTLLTIFNIEGDAEYLKDLPTFYSSFVKDNAIKYGEGNYGEGDSIID